MIDQNWSIKKILDLSIWIDGGKNDRSIEHHKYYNRTYIFRSKDQKNVLTSIYLWFRSKIRKKYLPSLLFNRGFRVWARNFRYFTSFLFFIPFLRVLLSGFPKGKRTITIAFSSFSSSRPRFQDGQDLLIKNIENWGFGLIVWRFI